MDWIALGISVWMISGMIPAFMLMLLRARKLHTVDPFGAVRGAVLGPVMWWVVVKRRKQRVL